MLKIGDKSPDFKLPADSGKEISINDLRGKKVILYFYPKDMTPGCTQEAQEAANRDGNALGALDPVGSRPVQDARG